ncbi:tyrosine-type recombinase/integrase [Pseudomonas citronellolis]|uniref:tyrosine-type recombinase/integrase n=1 Tax=Pseudomonas citronellolis TaxID=53408 RepID=UPI0018D80A93|nr:site-specific integrase [Pseudomonas citronellolis]MBH3431295.1 site-specific integrase [Pseudomonas citronellolis]
MKKLYKLTLPSQTLPFSITPDHRPISTDASNIPTLHWPDGSWCTEANMWMLDLYEKGLSRTERGGSLLAYATNISHLIRYAYAQNTPLLKITDAQFSFFITSLLGQRNAAGENTRNQNSVLNIARCCLQLINFLSEELDTRSKLKIERREITLILPNGNKIKKLGLHHPAMPIEARLSKRLPINLDNIKRLRMAAFHDRNSSAFIKERRRVMIRALEMTGGRRLEVKLLTVDAVLQAEETGHLVMHSAKQRGATLTDNIQGASHSPDFREVPITPLDLKLLKDFVDFHRKPLIQKLLGNTRDHGFVFISETTGRPLSSNNITFELYKLREMASIEEPVSPHLFRHRFITKIFVAEIMRKKIDTLDDFREALLSSETLKRKVAELTGHKNLASLDVYTHLAWDEAEQIKKSLPMFSKLQSIEAIREKVTKLIADLSKECISPEIKTLLDLLESFEALL